jgi:hypothetical protein
MVEIAAKIKKISRHPSFELVSKYMIALRGGAPNAKAPTKSTPEKIELYLSKLSSYALTAS